MKIRSWFLIAAAFFVTVLFLNSAYAAGACCALKSKDQAKAALASTEAPVDGTSSPNLIVEPVKAN